MALFDSKKTKNNIGNSNKDHNIIGSLKAKGDDLLASRKEKADSKKDAINNAVAEKESGTVVFPMLDSIRIMYCLMLSDGSISSKEEGKIEEIGRVCDPYFDTYKAQLFKECNDAVQFGTRRGIDAALFTPEEKEEYYDLIRDYVDLILRKDNTHNDNGMQAKTLLWNLLAIANSEGDYSRNEKRMIRFFASRTGIDQSVLLEMENTFSTLIAIEREEEWLKLTDRPYKLIEERVNELQNRKNAIMQGINALIMD